VTHCPCKCCSDHFSKEITKRSKRREEGILKKHSDRKKETFTEEEKILNIYLFWSVSVCELTCE
jgi:hypothetical protein